VSSNPSDDNEYHWDDGVSAGLTQPRIATVRELSLSEADEQYAEVVQHAQYVQDIAEEDADAGLACGRSAGEDSGLIKQVDVEDEEDAHDRRRCARSKLKNDDREDYEYGVAHRLEDNIDEDLDNGQPSEGEDGVDDVVRRGKDRSAEINDGEKHTHPPVATLAVNDDNDSATQEEDDPWFNQATQSTIVKVSLIASAMHLDSPPDVIYHYSPPSLVPCRLVAADTQHATQTDRILQEYTATADTTRKPSAWKVLSSQPPAAARRAMTTRLRAGSHIVHTNATAGMAISSFCLTPGLY
jgi:hypothetical protein